MPTQTIITDNTFADQLRVMRSRISLAAGESRLQPTGMMNKQCVSKLTYVQLSSLYVNAHTSTYPHSHHATSGTRLLIVTRISRTPVDSRDAPIV